MAQHPGSIWLDEHWAELKNNFWLAASSNGIMAQTRTFETLIDELRRQEIDLDNIAIGFVTFDVFQ